jgi:hypothetical protein
MQLKADNETYKAIIKEDLKSNFVAIPESVINRIGTGNQYFTSEQLVIDLQEEYVKLVKAYNQQRNKTFWQKIFNI